MHHGKKTRVALVKAAFSTEPEKIPAERCATADKHTHGRVHYFLCSLSNTFKVTQSCCICVGADTGLPGGDTQREVVKDEK